MHVEDIRQCPTVNWKELFIVSKTHLIIHGQHIASFVQHAGGCSRRDGQHDIFSL